MISLIVPTYNRTNYLEEALKSAIQQSYSDFEIIVSDNCSDPESFRQIVSVARSFDDERIRIRQNDENLGLLGNFIAAVRESRGRYVASLHDDDVWEPEFLERLVLPMEGNENISLSFSDHFIINGNSIIDYEFSDRNTQMWNRDELAEGIYEPFYRIGLVDRCIPTAMASVIRRSAVDWGHFPPGVGNAYDLWLTYLASKGGWAAYYCPERLTRYRMHDESTTALALLDLHEGLANCYDRFLEDPQLSELESELRKQSSHFHTVAGVALLRKGERKEAISHLKSGFTRYPSVESAAGLFLGGLPSGLVTKIIELRRSFLYDEQEQISPGGGSAGVKKESKTVPTASA